MLFSGLACFSPSVPPIIRKLWVTNGGRLTHTSADFHKANFFFCHDTQDPWLNELLSRSLIVRHAAWVTLCVAEEFCMPIAAYTLDDGFDISKIRILDATALARASGHPPAAESLRPQVGDNDPFGSGQLARKRPFDSEGNSQAQVDQPPKKKPRIGPTCKTQTQQMTTAHNVPEEDGKPPQVCFRNVSLPSGKVSKAVKTFESLIVHPTTISLPLTPKKAKDVAISPLNPHTLFWNDLFAKSFPKDGSAVLNLSVDDLIQAPRTKGTIFNVNKFYRGKKFINLDYT